MRNSPDFGHHRVLSKTDDYALRALLVAPGDIPPQDHARLHHFPRAAVGAR